MMFAEDLFDSNAAIDQQVYRNIVSLRDSADLFDDLSDDPEDQKYAIQAEIDVKKIIKPGDPSVIQKGWAYNKAIVYPFLTKPFIGSRFGDGSYGVWYGSLDLDTTIFETVYHLFRSLSGTEGHPDIVKQERAVFSVYCNGVLIDLSHKLADYPDLISNDYAFCHIIGANLQKEGHPGVLYASARYRQGLNTAVFNPVILKDTQHNCYLTYLFKMKEKKVVVERTVGKPLMTIDIRKHFNL